MWGEINRYFLGTYLHTRIKAHKYKKQEFSVWNDENISPFVTENRQTDVSLGYHTHRTFADYINKCGFQH